MIVLVDTRELFRADMVKKCLALITYAVAVLLLLVPGLCWNLAAAAGGPSGTGTTVGAANSSPYVAGELNVKFKEQAGDSVKSNLLQSSNLSVKHRSAALKFETLKVPKGVSVPEMAKKLQSDPLVEYAEPNYIDTIDMTPNDPLYPNQWNMHGFDEGGIDAQTAWDTTEGDPNIIVAVVDTGVAFENYGSYSQAPDLAGTTFVSPHNSIDETAHPNDVDGHGTHVTGTIAQTTNNSLGTAGVAHGCKIMPVRCLGTGGGSHAQMADAFTWATDHGAKIINYSAGGSDSQTKRDACQYAYSHGVTICAATGNDNGSIQYPAAYDDYCIAVGATARDKTRAYYSNYGSQIDVVGPGGDARVTTDDGVLQQTYITEGDPTSGFSYQGWTGTSMATPHVSGTAALFISKTGISNPDAVKLELEDTAHDLGDPGWDQYFGFGLVDANQALSPVRPLISDVNPANGVVGATVTVNGIHFGTAQGTSVVHFNGADATSYTSWSDTAITLHVPTGTTSGTGWVTTPDGDSNGFYFTADNPVPSISGLSPDHKAAGSAGFTVTASGSGFATGAVVRWNGSSRTTHYVSASQLTAEISAADVASAGSASVTVFNPAPGGGTSGAAPFSIVNPAPTLVGISPDHKAAGSAGFTVTVSGGGFATGAVVKWNGSSRTTHYVSASQLTAEISAADVASAGSASVTVFNPAPGGGTSNSRSFAVTTPVWYLAEGTTAWGFYTYISIENPNNSAIDAKVTYMTSGGQVAGPSVHLPAMSQATVNPEQTLGQRDFSTRVECVQGKTIAVDRTMSWWSGFGKEYGEHSSVGVTAPAKKWYLPEGSSAWGFECWLLLQNPNPTPANCTVTYMVEGGAPVVKVKTIPANSRRSFNMKDDIGEHDASIMVESDVGLIPERSMYKAAPGAAPGNRREGHDSIGTTAPATDYYLAEGTTAWGFTTYVLVQNPNDGVATVTLMYNTASGPVSDAPFTVAAKSRKTIRLNDLHSGMDLSTHVHADKPIIAERSMYWSPSSGAGEAMHDSIGMSEGHRTFYLPDGETRVDASNGNTETYTLVQNANTSAVQVRVSYLTPSGAGNVTWTETVPANSRKTFNMGDRLSNTRAAVVVECLTPGKKIMVERAMYFQNRWGGTDTIGGYSD